MSKDCDYLKWYVECPTTTVLLTGAAAVQSIIYGGGINSQRQPCPCPFLCPSSSSCPWLVLFWITRLIVDPRPGPRYVDQESKVLLHERCQQTNEHGESYASLQTYQL